MHQYLNRYRNTSQCIAQLNYIQLGCKGNTKKKSISTSHYLVRWRLGTRWILILLFVYYQPLGLLLITAEVHCSFFFFNCMISRLEMSKQKIRPILNKIGLG